MWCMLRSRSWSVPGCSTMDFPPPDDKSVVAPYLGLSAAK
jgi:hypothetical protein